MFHITLVFVRFSAVLFHLMFHCFSLTNLAFIQYGICNVEICYLSLLKLRLVHLIPLVSLHTIIGKGFLTPPLPPPPPLPHFTKSSYIYTFLSLTFFCCLVSLTEGVIAPHLMCFFLLNDIVDIYMLSLDTLVPEGPLCCFMQQVVSLLRSNA